MVVPENLEQVEAQQKKFDDFNKELSVQENRIKVSYLPLEILCLMAFHRFYIDDIMAGLE